MTLRRLFSCLVLTLVFLGSVADRDQVAADSAGEQSPALLGPGDLSDPSPYLGVSVSSGVTGLEAALDGRSLLRLPLSRRERPVDVRFDGRAEASRIRSTLLSLDEVAPDLAEARTGQRSARSTALPPPIDS